ncbi:protein of unknown function [Magnetospirillum sp. XM-1]|uniref:hypothetical protein n=1 Tax=Magnetospirillum sp. XM-1 TaxID=1663591 RepID=UPI00073DC7F4|nr:hypothetical protein [Magnetospirillum sp. XM-1]CUW38820.1 protein of unknown function [Magnetospirillum sp. XM-1]
MGYPPNFDREIDDNYLLDLELRGTLEGQELFCFLKRVRALMEDKAQALMDLQSAENCINSFRQSV